MSTAINNNEIMVLTKEGLQTFSNEILTAVNTKISDRIVSTINGSSDANHVPSAAAVYTAVNNVNNIKPLVIADGDISKASVTPDSKTLYMVRKSADSVEAIPYIYIDGFGFVMACAVNSIDPGDNMIAIPEDDIRDVVANAIESTNPGI